MLQVTDLHAFYGKSPVLQGVNLQVRPGEIVSLLGRNGAGRSTTVKALMGLVRCTGSVAWRGQPILGLPAFEIARLGLGYVPEARDIFPTLTVHQNLLLGLPSTPRRGRAPPRWGFDQVYRQFPHLAERQHTAAGVLSGGEQQMLTLCRALMGDPDLLLIDEPTEGLAPQAVQQVAGLLRTLRGQGVSVLLVEQKLDIALQVSDRCLLMGRGRILLDGTPADLLAALDLRQAWLQAQPGPG